MNNQTIVFSALSGQDPPAQTIAITNSGPAGSVLNWAATASTASGGNWLFVSPTAGTNAGTLQIAAHAGSLGVGSYSGTVTISAPGAQNSPITITVTSNIVQPPAIQAIVDSWGYSSGIAPGLWVTIGGTNLATGNPQTWNLSGTPQLPTTLGGVTVTFNGTQAALYYVSATQINALVPASVAPGPVQAIVQANGVSSAPFTITATATQPAVYAPPSSDGSQFFVTAALQGTGFLVGNSSTDPRVVRAVYPGDILDLYMIGLGGTADPSKFLTNQSFSSAYTVSAQVTATIGGENAPMLFAGLTSPGLYLVRVSVPSDLTAGSQPIQITAGSAQTHSSVLVSLAAAPPNLIQNGSFEAALTGTWTLDVHSNQGAAATIQRTGSTDTDGGSSAQITVTSAATDPSNIGAVQLFQAGFPIQQGRVYMLQFWAKADAARTMQFNIVQNGTPFQNYGLYGAVPVGGDWARYVVYFQATVTDPAARIDYYFGGQPGTTWLDGVLLTGSGR